MLDFLFGGRTRLMLLRKFFVTAGDEGYLRELSRELGISSNAVRRELVRFEDAGLLVSRIHQNRKIYSANADHPLFDDLVKMFGEEQLPGSFSKLIEN